MRQTITIFTSVFALACVFVTTPLLADDEPSLDDLLDLPKDTSPDKDDAKPDDGKTDDKLPIDPNVTEPELTGDQVSAAFKSAVKDMSVVGTRLNERADAGLDTQRMQESILRRLDQIIASAKKQQQQGKSGKSDQNKNQKEQSGSRQNQGQKSQKGQAQKNNQGDGRGTQGSPDDHKAGAATDEAGAGWGSLPARLRDELIQGRDDRFSAPYETLTQQFYKRVAEEGR